MRPDDKRGGLIPPTKWINDLRDAKFPFLRNSPQDWGISNCVMALPPGPNFASSRVNLRGIINQPV